MILRGSLASDFYSAIDGGGRTSTSMTPRLLATRAAVFLVMLINRWAHKEKKSSRIGNDNHDWLDVFLQIAFSVETRATDKWEFIFSSLRRRELARGESGNSSGVGFGKFRKERKKDDDDVETEESKIETFQQLDEVFNDFFTSHRLWKCLPGLRLPFTVVLVLVLFECERKWALGI